jgi:uncharacterized membrane protein YeaQ/YmgE (transglycosylase-associated protein family)
MPEQGLRLFTVGAFRHLVAADIGGHVLLERPQGAEQAGWRHYGVVGDMGLSILGAVVGGSIFGLLMPGSSAGLIGSIVVAFVGAVILIALARAFTGSRASV